LKRGWRQYWVSVHRCKGCSSLVPNARLRSVAEQEWRQQAGSSADTFRPQVIVVLCGKVRVSIGLRKGQIDQCCCSTAMSANKAIGKTYLNLPVAKTSSKRRGVMQMSLAPFQYLTRLRTCNVSMMSSGAMLRSASCQRSGHTTAVACLAGRYGRQNLMAILCTMSNNMPALRTT
jgi:hypothetical protein